RPSAPPNRVLRTPTEGAIEADLAIDGQRIHTYVWGDPAAQPYVLFAHGWSSHATRFVPWVRRVRALGYAAVAFDQPAHGRSPGHQATLPAFTHVLQVVGDHYGPAAAVV